MSARARSQLLPYAVVKQFAAKPQTGAAEYTMRDVLRKRPMQLDRFVGSAAKTAHANRVKARQRRVAALVERMRFLPAEASR